MNTYGRSTSVPRSRRRTPIASTVPLALAAEETLEEVAAGLAAPAPAEERARHGGREGRVGAHVGPADRPAGAERDGEPPARIDQHGPRLRLAEQVVGERRGGHQLERRIQVAIEAEAPLATRLVARRGEHEVVGADAAAGEAARAREPREAEVVAREEVRVALARAVRHARLQERLQRVEHGAPEAGTLDAPVGDHEPPLAGGAARERGRLGRRARERAVHLERPRGPRPILRRRQLGQLEAVRIELGSQPGALPLAGEMRPALDGTAERLERRRLEVEDGWARVQLRDDLLHDERAEGARAGTQRALVRGPPARQLEHALAHDVLEQ